MSPVAPSGGHAGRALAVATVAIVVVLGGLFLASVALSNRNSTDLQVGDRTFGGGSTSRLAREIAERGPIIYGDVSGRKDRDMILQHLGPNPDTGWSAFLAAPPDAPRSCTWRWQRAERQFRARCDRSRTAPADGGGLPQFAVSVSGGRIDVDLNAPPRSAPPRPSAPA